MTTERHDVYTRVTDMIITDLEQGPSDNLLTVKVENALNAEHVFQGMRVTVTVSKGVVTLSGFVTSDAAKVLASEDAGNVTGVKTVLNTEGAGAQTALPYFAARPPQNPLFHHDH